MNNLTDQQLLRDYAGNGSEAAFSELVRRHVDFVYSAARRMVQDTYLAEDVTQSTFIALAQNAQKLQGHLVLSGWLHRTAQNLAVKVVRTEVRRRAREQQAVAMNELQPETDVTWATIEPHLDTALNELSGADRDVVLLRYFERKSAREIAQFLGVSDEAAQKRLNRAVERLRQFFSRRNVTVSAGGLVVLISTNAVQSAPIGLVSATASGMSLTGATASSSTAITVTKAIAMTTMQKVLVTTALVVVLGAGMYEANQASGLREQNQKLQQQQAPLIAQLQQLQREHDDATNRLSAANAEIAQFKSGRSQTELLKLRGQVGTLRQQLGSATAKNESPMSGLEKMTADPAMKKFVQQTAEREIKLRFAELFQELKLSREQIEQFARTYANSGDRTLNTTITDDADAGNWLRSILGEAGYARLKEFEQEVPARAALKLLNSQLGGSRLTEEQSSRFLQIVKAEPYELIYGIEGDLNKALGGSQSEVDEYLRQVAESNQRIIQQASTLLSPDQISGLDLVLTNALKIRSMQAEALVQKH